jgi:hypothetical protein
MKARWGRAEYQRASMGLMAFSGPEREAIQKRDGPNPPATPTLIIRVHNTSSASESELEEMKQSASQVFRRSRIEVEWVSCTSSSRHSALCPDPGASATRTIVFVR